MVFYETLRIAVNGRFCVVQSQESNAFATEILLALDRLISARQRSTAPIEVLLPPGVEPKVQFDNMPFRTVGRRQGHLWEQLDLPHACSGAWLLNLCNTVLSCCCNQNTVVHDAAVFAVPQAYSLGFKVAYRLLHLSSLR